MKLAAGQSSNLPIIIGGLAVVVLVVITLVCRMLLNSVRKQTIDLERMKKAKSEFENTEAHDLSQFKSPSKQYNKVEPNSMEMHNTMSKMVVQYAPQYDANHDFAIFGTGDGAQGGVQTLQQKMNLADGQTDSTADKMSSTNSQSQHGRRQSSGLAEDQEIEIECLD
jgi:uncharacterized membrane-anchored protein YhcB (DUF1043 family)